MCVDKHHFKCCGCLSLTTATLLLGAINLAAVIYYGIMEEWASLAVGCISVVLMAGVLVKPHDANIRKLLFYIATTLAVIGFIALVIVFFVWLANDTYYEWCTLDSMPSRSDLNDWYNCIDNIKTWFIITFCIAIVLDALLVFCTTQILYFGWKE